MSDGATKGGMRSIIPRAAYIPQSKHTSSDELWADLARIISPLSEDKMNVIRPKVNELKAYIKTNYIPKAALNPLDSRIGMLRQWLNEERIKDGKRFVTNEDLAVWLQPQDYILKADVVEALPEMPDFTRLETNDYTKGMYEGWKVYRQQLRESLNLEGQK